MTTWKVRQLKFFRSSACHTATASDVSSERLTRSINGAAFSATLTSLAKAENQTWPFVVFPDFQVHALVSNKIVRHELLKLHPSTFAFVDLHPNLFSRNMGL